MRLWRQTPSYFGVALSMASAVMVTFAISNVAAYAATISFKKTPSRVKFTPRNSNPDLLFFLNASVAYPFGEETTGCFYHKFLWRGLGALHEIKKKF